MKRFLTIFILVTNSFIFFNPSPATCQIADKLRFRQITSYDGLSQNFVTCLLQDDRKFMWIGTKNGLNRYDGYTFIIYRNNPSRANSLSSSYITSLYEDPYRHLWIGTKKGLNLFNRDNNNFVRIYLPEVNAGEQKLAITAITSAGNDHLWIGTNTGDIFELSFSLKNTNDLIRQEKGYPIKVKNIFHVNVSGSINSLYASDGILWIGSDHGLWQLNLEDAQPKLRRPQYTTSVIAFPGKNALSGKRNKNSIKKVDEKLSPLYSHIQHIATDSSGNIWMSSDSCLYQYNRKQNRYYAFILDSGWTRKKTIRSLALRKLPQKKIQVWAGLDNGIAILDLNDSTFTYYNKKIHNEENNTFGPAVCTCFDKSGMFWLGTNGYGVRTFSPEVSLFNLPNLPIDGAPGLTLIDLNVRSFCEMPVRNEKNILWVGSSKGLYKINRTTRVVKKVFSPLKNGFHLQDDVYALAHDSSGNLFIGYKYGLMKYNPVGNKTTSWNPYKNFKQVAYSQVQAILIDHAGNLWIATNYSLSRFVPEKDNFVHYWYRPISELGKLYDPTHPVVWEDKTHKLWLGTKTGLFCFDPAAGKYIAHYEHNINDPRSISSNWVSSIMADPRQPQKYLWITTIFGGLNRFDLTTKQFIHFTEKDGLSSNNVYAILAGGSGRFWMSTDDGITRFDPIHHTFSRFDLTHNLQGYAYNFGAYYESSSGEMFFGGFYGYNYFSPEKIKPGKYAPPLWITDIRLPDDHNEEISVPENLQDTDEITLSHKVNHFTITLSSLDFAAPGKNKYAYRVKNQSEKWIPLGTDREVTFNYLTPGKYIFQAKATNSTGNWSSKIMQLAITIAPPWWRTAWAYLIYILALIGLIFFFRKRELNRVRLQLEAAKLKELDHLKSRFFANISHEFRTPLTLLTGPLEDLMNGGDLKAFKEIVPEMYRNSKRLLRLINQLLDLSRLDAGKYQINTEQENIIPFVKQVVNSFSSMVQAKNIRLKTDVDPHLRNKLAHKKAAFYFDDDIIEKILSNLLSNAFKFTSNGGHIIITLCLSEKEPDFLELKVEDNGEGIPEDQLPYIFDRFYQAGNSGNQSAGSGIGLALIKELVELHSGEISVNSEEGQGATFICLLPFNKKVFSNTKIRADKKQAIDPLKDNGAEEESIAIAGENGNEGQPVILIVEDQQDVRKYIRSHLKDQYAVLEARDGRQGLQVATENIPDLVISDVMMPVRPGHPGEPEMDGFELCAALKTDNRTSHVPVILLTARAEDNDKMTGLETGADAYLIKPFNSKELLIRVKNLISLRNKMRAKFSNKLMVKPAEIAVTPVGRKFMQKLLQIVETHIDDQNFSVTALSKEVNMSISQLNRKLKAIVNQPASQFIRSVRLQRALELLKKGSGSISEIAFKTGFETPSYFTKVFKAQFGCLPSEKEKFPE